MNIRNYPHHAMKRLILNNPIQNNLIFSKYDNWKLTFFFLQELPLNGKELSINQIIKRKHP